MKIKVKGFEGTLTLLEKQWTHEYEYKTDRYRIELMIDRNTTVELVNVKSDEIEFVEEE